MDKHKRNRDKKSTSKNSPPIQFKCTMEEFEDIKFLSERHMPGLKVAAFVRGIVLTYVRNERNKKG